MSTPNRISVTSDESQSRNAMTDLEDEEAVIGRTDPRLFDLALLAAVLDQAGHRLIPPLYRGGHTRIVLSSGERLSLSEFMMRRRWHRWMTATCEVCGQLLGVRRMDANYCSNACRQRAYRRRLRSPTHRKGEGHERPENHQRQRHAEPAAPG